MATVEQLQRELDELRAHEEIRKVLYLYTRGVDRCDAELLRDVYHEDSTDIHGRGFAGNGKDLADSLIPWISKLPFNRHQVTNVIIELDGDRAFVESQYDATHRFPLDDGGAVDRRVQGRYLDVFERRDERWRILHRRTIADASWARELSAAELSGPAGEQRPAAHPALESGHAPEDPVYLGFAISEVDVDAHTSPDPALAVSAHYASDRS